MTTMATLSPDAYRSVAVSAEVSFEAPAAALPV
jgi:hypothetical protein